MYYVESVDHKYVHYIPSQVLCLAVFAAIADHVVTDIRSNFGFGAFTGVGSHLS